MNMFIAKYYTLDSVGVDIYIYIYIYIYTC